jgi:hypothetical protein
MTQGWARSVKVAKRELLLRAAREEFAELGLEGATMRGIAMSRLFDRRHLSVVREQGSNLR